MEHELTEQETLLLARVNARFAFEDNGPIPETLIVTATSGGYYRAKPEDVFKFVLAELKAATN